MPTDLSGFVPDAAPAPKLPPGFIPDAKTSAASTDQGTLTASIPKETFDASGRQVGPSQNFISRKLREAEDLTEEGKKAHPVEAFVGKVANAFKMPTNPVNIVGQMAPLLFAGEMPAPEDAAIAPHAERFAAPNEGKVATGPAPAQAYSRYGMKPENAVPNAAGTRDVGVRVTPPSTGGTMRPTVGETAPLRPEQKLLPAGPVPKLNAFGEPIPELQTDVGRTAAPAEAPKPQLTEAQANETRAQIADLERQARAANQKQGAARGWQTANRWAEREKNLVEKAEQMKRDLGLGKAARPAEAPFTKEQQLASYNAAPDDVKAQVDELAKLYPKLQSFERTEFEKEHSLNSAMTKGLPLKEKLARSLTRSAGETEAVPAFLTGGDEGVVATAEREPGDESEIGHTVREVFARNPVTSRSTPTGPSVPLPPELHADLERQAGRSLTDAEANALDRANLERGMIDASGRPDEASAIREAKRAELEQPGRPEIGQSAPVTGPTISTPAEANAAPGPKPTARQQIGKIVDMATGREPLNPKVSLREQIGRTVETPPNAKTELEAKYPNKAVRQMVHVQGERMVQAIGDDKQLMRDVHDLTKVDLSRAAENGGLDLGQKAITSSKFAGEGGITRQQVFEQLLDKGYSPREIVDLAKKEPTSK